MIHIRFREEYSIKVSLKDNWHYNKLLHPSRVQDDQIILAYKNIFSFKNYLADFQSLFGHA